MRKQNHVGIFWMVQTTNSVISSVYVDSETASGLGLTGKFSQTSCRGTRTKDTLQLISLIAARPIDDTHSSLQSNRRSYPRSAFHQFQRISAPHLEIAFFESLSDRGHRRHVEWFPVDYLC